MTEVSKQVATMIEAEQRKLMSEMRRRTSLDDQEIQKLLAPFSEAAFGAGYKLGWRDGEVDVLGKASRYKLASMIATAALVAWWLVTGLWPGG